MGVKASIHDKFSVEFKFAYAVRKLLNENQFAINTWVFIPESLDINATTYPKKRLFSDIKTNTRLITPAYLLRDIATEKSLPFDILKKAFQNVSKEPTRTHINEYEYQIKMFASIFRASIRDHYTHIIGNNIIGDTETLCLEMVKNVEIILIRYRELRSLINVPSITTSNMDFYLLGDEFISDLAQNFLFKTINYIETVGSDKINNINILLQFKKVIENENQYKKRMNYPVLDLLNKDKNRNIIRRFDILKKYVESDLHLESTTKRDGIVIQQIYYSIAAGVSMIFATFVAFSFQKKYGNFTMPLFVALVVSYVLKDRIKELMRFYFAYKLGHKYFDSKTTIKIKNEFIGWKKDAVDYINIRKVPEKVMELRRKHQLINVENYLYSNDVLLIRKLIRIERDKLEKNSEYFLKGIDEIVRLDIKRYIYNMDNPEFELQGLDENGNVISINGEKTYVIYVVMQLDYINTITYTTFRITLSRDEIISVETLN